VPFIGKGGWLSTWAQYHRCDQIKGCGQPVIHLLLPWTLLITAPEAVEGRFLGSVSPGMTVGRCGRPSRCGRPYSVSWDELPLPKDAYDCIGMTVVVVERPDKWTH
jgi:hypothetical protein